MVNGKCEACREPATVLVAHHWFEIPDLTYQERRICPRCNRILETKQFYDSKFYTQHKDSIHHILPSWDKQVGVVRAALKALERVRAVAGDATSVVRGDREYAERMRQITARRSEALAAGLVESKSGGPSWGWFLYRDCCCDLAPDSDCFNFHIEIGFESVEKMKAFVDDWIDNDRGCITKL